MDIGGDIGGDILWIQFEIRLLGIEIYQEF
jgi:hypothetical protein